MNRFVALLAASVVALSSSAARAETPVVVDRDVAFAQLQALSTQVAGIEQQIRGDAMLASAPSSANLLQVVAMARQQIKELQRHVGQAQGCAAPSPTVAIITGTAGAGVGGSLAGGTVFARSQGQSSRVVVGARADRGTVQTVGPDGVNVIVRTDDGFGQDPQNRAVARYPGPQISADDLQSLVAAVRAEGFSENRLRVLREAAPQYWFLVSQIAEVLPHFSFSEDKVKALDVLAQRILDRKNAFKIYKLFPFSADKEAARQILER